MEPLHPSSATASVFCELGQRAKRLMERDVVAAMMGARDLANQHPHEHHAEFVGGPGLDRAGVGPNEGRRRDGPAVCLVVTGAHAGTTTSVPNKGQAQGGEKVIVVGGGEKEARAETDRFRHAFGVTAVLERGLIWLSRLSRVPAEALRPGHQSAQRRSRRLCPLHRQWRTRPWLASSLARRFKGAARSFPVARPPPAGSPRCH
jgi:hypothetical protein